MTNLQAPPPALADLEGGLASLRGDCARMAPHWTATAAVSGPGAAPVTAAAPLTGVTVPSSSARLLEAMSDYGNHGS
ncbi:hypothetical protein ACIQU5_30025 [Streptomyces sp. NPDC090306]|uniref:hypothetical protein n=1 Tax=unclassified Streptomyces TaxID=2593676 RepID=UPI0036EE65AF